MREHWAYLRDLLRHKRRVYRHCARLGIRGRGLRHDLSKLRPSEWRAAIAYRKARAHGNRRIPAQVKWAWEEAAHRHRQRNDHHWQYWIDVDEGRPIARRIPDPALRELVADWLAWGEEPGRESAWEYWRTHRTRLFLHPLTQMQIRELLTKELAAKEAR